MEQLPAASMLCPSNQSGLFTESSTKNEVEHIYERLGYGWMIGETSPSLSLTAKT
jgi:hypothetical protein